MMFFCLNKAARIINPTHQDGDSLWCRPRRYNIRVVADRDVLIFCLRFRIVRLRWAAELPPTGAWNQDFGHR